MDWNDLKWKISRWLEDSPLVYINTLNVFKLYWPWNKVKDLFKRPVWKCQMWYPYNWCILKIHMWDLGWKTKYEDYRHEENPYITVQFLKWCWRFELVPPGKDEEGRECEIQYYETILTYLFDKRFKGNFKKAFEYCNAWTGMNSKDYLTCKSCLTEKGLDLIK